MGQRDGRDCGVTGVGAVLGGRGAWIIALAAGSALGLPGWLLSQGVPPMGTAIAMAQDGQPQEEDLSRYTQSAEAAYDLYQRDRTAFERMMVEFQRDNPESAAELRRDVNILVQRQRQQDAAGRNAQGLEDARRRMTGEDAPGVGKMVPAEGDLGPLGPDGEPVGVEADGAGTLRLDFAEPVDLLSFAGYVANKLHTNIFADETLSGQTVVFHAPIKVRIDQLIPLLGALVEERGFTLAADPMGWFTIRPSAQQLPVDMLSEGGLATTRIIPTPLVRPSQLVVPIQTSFQNQAIRLAPVDDIGALIVTAPTRTIAQVEAMVNRIISDMRQQKLRRIPLQYVSADYAIARILEINGKLGGGLGIQGGGQLNPGAVASAGALTSLDSRLFVDQGNALLFKGTEDELEQLKELVEMIDQISPLISRRYTAGTVVEDVARAAEREGLGPVSYSVTSNSPGGFGTSGFGNSRNIGGQFNLGNQQAATYGSGFSVDVQTGSFVYHGTESQHERVAQLVREFSEQAIRDKIEIRAYKLHHADPVEVKRILEELIRDEQEQRGTFFTQSASQRNDLVTPETEGGAGEQAGESNGFAVSAEKTVVSDDPSNAQVIVKARARDHEQIAKVIESLDQRRPQVAIKAKIISVTVRDSFDWTADVQINAGQFSFLSSFGLTTGPAGNLPGPRNVTNNLRGATTAIIKSDFLPIAINALKTVGDTRVVSAPQIVANDNTEGSVESKREEPFSSVSQGTGSTVTSQGGTAEAGTKLTVTPQISEGGYLKLDYEFELSEFDQAAAAGGGLQPPSQRELYKSTVTIPSGTTVVVGGFVLERDSKSDQMVPILGEIPILGAAFKDYSKSKTRTMIFVFITPEILTDQNFVDLRLISESPIEAMGVEGGFKDFTPIRVPVKGSVGPRESGTTGWE